MYPKIATGKVQVAYFENVFYPYILFFKMCLGSYQQPVEKRFIIWGLKIRDGIDD
jgi:hypothetical protein